jgi:protein-S-isoprenylcysteine O-methyltransferase
MAMAFSEYFIELYFLPSMKLSSISAILTFTGVIVAIVGHYFRAGAEFTAQSNFTHQISFRKKPEHKLITHGVYAISRHPGYFGWFLWSVSTQVMI